MIKENAFQTEKLRITEVKLMKEQIESSYGFNIKEMEGFSVNTSFDIGFIPDDKLTRAELSVNISTISKDEQTVPAKGSFLFAFYIEVENLDDLIEPSENEGKANVSEELGIGVASVAYSTARGILLSRLQNTVFEKFILPVINPNVLLKQ